MHVIFLFLFRFFLFSYLAVSNARLARARVTTHGRGEPWYAGRFRDSGINASPFLLSRAHFRVPELCGRRRRGENKQVPGDVTTEQIKGQQHVSSRKTRWCYINRKENKKKRKEEGFRPGIGGNTAAVNLPGRCRAACFLPYYGKPVGKPHRGI